MSAASRYGWGKIAVGGDLAIFGDRELEVVAPAMASAARVNSGGGADRLAAVVGKLVELLRRLAGLARADVR